MKSPTIVIITFGLASGCTLFQHGDDAGYQFPDDIDLYDGPAVAHIQGTVRDVDGVALADIPVTLSNGDEVLTDESGHYRFDSVDPDRYVVSVSIIEYAEQFKKVELADWRTHSANFELYPTGVIFDVDNSQGGLFQEGRLLVDVPPFAFARDGGSPDGATVQLALTVPDLLETGTAGSPGNFSVVDDDRVLASFGFWDIRVFQDGEQINVADGSTVSLDYELMGDDEIPEAQRYLMSDTMPLWTFDTEEAAWVQMDEVEVQEDDRGHRTVTAELPHFSPWNYDELFDSTCVEVWVEDEMGNPIEGVEVALEGTDYVSATVTTTDENGLGVVMGMPSGTADLKAEMMVGDRPYTEVIENIDLGTAVSSGQICPIAETITIPVCMVGGDIRLNVTNTTTTGDDGKPVESRIPSGAAQFYVPSDEFGACDDPIGEQMDPGDWLTIEPEEDPTDLYEDEVYEDTPAGDVIRLDDNEVAVDMTLEENTDLGDIYVVEAEEDLAIEIGELLTDGSTLDITVQGEEGGLPGFEVNGAIELADTPTIDVVASSTTPPTTTSADGAENSPGTVVFVKGDDLTLELEDTASADDTFAMVLTDDGDMYIGKFAAGDSPTIPDWLTQEMPDDGSVTLFKQKVSYVELPTGYYARTTTMNASTVVTTAE